MVKVCRINNDAVLSEIRKDMYVAQQVQPSQHNNKKVGLVARKPVFGVSEKGSFELVSSATETSKNIEIPPVASLHMILFKKQITKALIRLRGCAGWSAPVLFANHRRQIFLRRGPYSLGTLSTPNKSPFQCGLSPAG